MIDGGQKHECRFGSRHMRGSDNELSVFIIANDHYIGVIVSVASGVAQAILDGHIRMRIQLDYVAHLCLIER